MFLMFTKFLSNNLDAIEVDKKILRNEKKN